MKSHSKVFENLKSLLEKHNQLQEKAINDILIGYALEYTDCEIEDIQAFARVIKEMPSASSTVRLLSKLRTDYPHLDTRKKTNTESGINDFKQYLNNN